MSYHFNLPSGPAIVLIAGLQYLVSVVVGSRGGLVKEFVGNMVAQFGANLDRKLAGGEARVIEMDVGGVFWRWLKGPFFKRGGAK